jgi:preprotein translocase subunit SecE
MAGRIVESMADFLSVLSIVAFIAVFSGLIWALDRV